MAKASTDKGQTDKTKLQKTKGGASKSPQGPIDPMKHNNHYRTLQMVWFSTDS